MNLQQAISAVIDGKKVKLPEWTGYWFIPTGNTSANMENEIRILTKGGDILDTPWFEKCKDRDDFEITEGKLGFDFATLALKNGKCVCRQGWNGKGMFIFKIEGNKLADKLSYGYGEMVGEPTFVDTLCIKSAQNTLVIGWHPSIPDMLAEDWELYTGPTAQ